MVFGNSSMELPFTVQLQCFYYSGTAIFPGLSLVYQVLLRHSVDYLDYLEYLSFYMHILIKELVQLMCKTTIAFDAHCTPSSCHIFNSSSDEIVASC